MRIVCLFNLKEGVSVEEYEEWARDTDLPHVNALGSIRSFTINRATGLFGSDAKPPYDYVEVIDVADMDTFVADVSDPAMQEVAAAFQQFADSPTFIMTEEL